MSDAQARPPIPALPGLLLVMILVPLDQTALTPALPEIAGDLGGLEQMPAVMTAYVVAVTAVLPVYGKLGDRFGRKPVLLAALLLFVAGALWCALATSLPTFVLARVLQGIGGGGLMVGAQATLGEIISPRERGRYLGLFGAVYVVPAVAGPLLGGLLVDIASWRWIFAIHVPLGALALGMLAITLRLPRPGRGEPIDVLGSLALAGTVVGTVLLANMLVDMVGWQVGLLGLGTAAAFAIWLASTRFARDPVLPFALLRRRGVAIPVLLSFSVGFALFGTISYVPAFARVGLGASAIQSGLVVTGLMAGAILTMTVTGGIITRTGRYRRYPIAGTALIAGGALILGLAGPRLDGTGLIAALFVIGLGVGMVMQVVMLAAQNAADPSDLGAVTSSVLFLRQVGASVGVALVGALVTHSFVGRVPAQVADAASLTPEAIAGLPSGTRELVESAFATAVPSAILIVTPLLAVSFLLALALPALPLRTQAEIQSIKELT